jgi:hypothetical protein
MKYKHSAILIFAFISIFGSSFAAPLDFSKYGFQIGALDTPPGDSPTQVIMMFLPTKNGFAPNVNVMIQPYAGTIKDYASLSKGQFEDMKFKIISEKSPSGNEWICE